MTMRLAEHAAELLQVRLLRFSVVAGGDLSEVVEIELADGRVAIAKGGPGPSVEAKMLAALRSAGVPVPRVLASDTSVLVIERLPTKGQLQDAWSDLGSVLARLHSNERDAEASSGGRYGWSDDYAFGEVSIVNAWSADWPSFWAEHRLLNHARLLPINLTDRLEKLAAILSSLLPANPAPVLLHGDLWGGNVLVSNRRISGLIDPACYYGHREVDIAMLRLFNQPGEAFFEAYGSLSPGHETRLPIYQLWPALVHLRLFGSTYRALVERMLAAVGV